MTTPQTSEKPQTTLTQDLSRMAQYYLGNRRGLMIIAGVAIVGGLTFNWGWLVAAGIAPILISVLPCVAMCAIGVCCMKKTAGQSSPEKSAGDNPSQIETGQTAPTIQNSALEELPMGDAGQRPSSGEADPTLDHEDQPLKERKRSDA